MVDLLATFEAVGLLVHIPQTFVFAHLVRVRTVELRGQNFYTSKKHYNLKRNADLAR